MQDVGERQTGHRCTAQRSTTQHWQRRPSAAPHLYAGSVGLATMRASRWNRPSATNTSASCSPEMRGAVQPSTSPGLSGRAWAQCGASVRRCARGGRADARRCCATGIPNMALVAAPPGPQQSYLGDGEVRVVGGQRRARRLDAGRKLDGACQHQARARRKVVPVRGRWGQPGQALSKGKVPAGRRTQGAQLSVRRSGAGFQAGWASIKCCAGSGQCAQALAQARTGWRPPGARCPS